MYRDTSEILTEKGIRPSIQRLKIYNYLYHKKNHPTVDMMYSSLSPEIPTLSKTTVYNTLRLFVEHNLVQALTIDEDEVRYDANVDFHYHFKCAHCGAIYDVFAPEPNIAQFVPDDFAVQSLECSIRGTCKACKSCCKA